MDTKDVKILWARSGGLCAICQTRVTEDGAVGAFVVGEHAHIAGDKPSAARHDPTLSQAERDGYANRILLCPTCHRRIDKDEASFSTARLHVIKANHERHVTSRLVPTSESSMEPPISDQLYHTIVSEASTCLSLGTWSEWTYMAARYDGQMKWSLRNQIEWFAGRVKRVVWPGKDDELERAIQTLAFLAECAVNHVGHHAELEEVDGQEVLRTVRFYKTKWHANEAHYNELLSQFLSWSAERRALFIEATRAANWFADAVRSRLDPNFFLLDGRFASIEAADARFASLHVPPQFTAKQKQELPEGIRDHIKSVLAE